MNTELQSFTSDRIYCAVDLAEQKPGDIDILNLGCKSFYIKDEADKVIAELEKKLDIYKRGWMENDKVNANQYAEIRHHKYKRCLAMAMWCDEAYHRECGLNPEEMTDKEFYKQQIEFWPRWSSRWLAIAEKFKEP